MTVRTIEYKKIRVDLFLTGFLHFQEELEAFGKTVIPIVREKEAELVNRGLLTPAGVLTWRRGSLRPR
ncbi:hypothetical protein [Brevibacterium permense]|uniref:Uncharacterized protein n=1 Tax=Brevibacterium permense TaxID=234834 RepID=A0ABN2AJ89_9MICO